MREDGSLRFPSSISGLNLNRVERHAREAQHQVEVVYALLITIIVISIMVISRRATLPLRSRNTVHRLDSL